MFERGKIRSYEFSTRKPIHAPKWVSDSSFRGDAVGGSKLSVGGSKLGGLSAESAMQQSLGRKPQEKQGAKRALQGRHSGRAAPSELIFLRSRYPGFQSPLRVLLHPGLCCAAPSALDLFQP
jgi:hypothetical protein